MSDLAATFPIQSSMLWPSLRTRRWLSTALRPAASVMFSVVALTGATFLVLSASCANAQEVDRDVGGHVAQAEPISTITVRGSASVTLTQGGAVVRLGVERRDPAASVAFTAMRGDLARLAGAFADLGIDPSRIRTESLNLSPAYKNEAIPQGGWRQVADGHVASSMLSVRVEDVDAIGAVIDTATNAGANRVLGVEFIAANDPYARAKALTAAVYDARNTAEKMAEAAGMRLGPAVEIVEQSDWRPKMESATMMRASADTEQTPVFAGEAVMEVSVHSVWMLKR